VADAASRSSRFPLPVPAGILASAAILLTGCTSAAADGDGNQGAAGEPIAIGKVSVISSAEQLTFHLDAYHLSPQQSRKIEEALDVLVSDCMTKQGFTWAVPKRPPLRDGTRNSRRYGLLDPEEGSRTGYHGTASTGKGAKESETGQDDSAAAQQAAGACVISQKAKLNGQQKADATSATARSSAWCSADLRIAVTWSGVGGSISAYRICWKSSTRTCSSRRSSCQIACSILVIVWHLINDPTARFTDLGPDWHSRRLDPARKTRDLVRQLQALGHDVTLAPAA
jgi:hypothetical protein